ncbi:MAG: hypothetical protein H6740_25205 [Alphaproteobacteria bacterium]|nr:hypothetical protein [Alphaproteobacteria bacterium]
MRIRRLLPSASSPSAWAAPAAETTYGGYDMVDAFPVDGVREWDFANESKPFDIHMVMGSGSSIVNVDGDDVEVKTFEIFFGPDGPSSGDLFMNMKWSADSYNGILLHGYEVFTDRPTDDNSGGDDTSGGGDDTGGARGPLEAFDFSPPIQFADKKMIPARASPPRPAA